MRRACSTSSNQTLEARLTTECGIVRVDTKVGARGTARRTKKDLELAERPFSLVESQEELSSNVGDL